MTEFTGERVIPGQVNSDLWAEHIARYAYASQLATGKRVLDAGCGTGYGTLALAQTALYATGMDVAQEAIAYAVENSGAANVRYARGSATALPFSAASFDLITAFEVIEHLSDWRDLLSEARRVLTPSGVFLVSTPNKFYYAETREKEGPNPYHVHEFEFAEFQSALRQFFPHVSIQFQNRVDAFAFFGAPTQRPSAVQIEATAGGGEAAHFFIGVCAIESLPDLAPFVYVPRAANVLREREQHIKLLENELAQNQRWLDKSISDLSALQKEHESQTEHLAQQNRWAIELENQLTATQSRVAQLQDELRTEQRNSTAVAAGYAKKVAELEQENREKTNWAIETESRLTADLAARAQQLAETVHLLDTAEQTVVERTEWAQRLEAEMAQLRAMLEMIRESRWIKVGRTVGLGPRVD